MCILQLNMMRGPIFWNSKNFECFDPAVLPDLRKWTYDRDWLFHWLIGALRNVVESNNWDRYDIWRHESAEYRRVNHCKYIQHPDDMYRAVIQILSWKIGCKLGSLKCTSSVRWSSQIRTGVLEELKRRWLRTQRWKSDPAWQTPALNLNACKSG